MAPWQRDDANAIIRHANEVVFKEYTIVSSYVYTFFLSNNQVYNSVGLYCIIMSILVYTNSKMFFAFVSFDTDFLVELMTKVDNQKMIKI
jgi:hypothetical protein